MNWCDHDDEANRSRLFGTAPSIATNIDVASKRTLATIPSGRRCRVTRGIDSRRGKHTVG